ncbi:MAG: MerR family transcriptional regulator [Spirochaetales bacterium]|jgi:DNA-binding transcriptional MerR regulator
MYRISELAAAAGVTVRTLRYYDKFSLLSPSRHSASGYRLYDETAALRLQQILFYRELGLPLGEIKRLIGAPEFDFLAALESHKVELGKRIARLRNLSRTVENTIAYMKGETSMEKAGIFAGFTPEEEDYYSKEAEKMCDPEIVRESNRRWKAYGAEGQRRILEEGKAIYSDMIAAMPGGPGSPKVQELVGRWRAHMSNFWTPDLDQLAPLAENYSNDQRFKANFDAMHPRLAEFMGQAVRVYVERMKERMN